MSFQRKHALEFGLEIVELEEKGNMPFVMGLHYLLCMYRGQYVRPMIHKCTLTDNIHIFKAPFIKQHYFSHLKQHYLSHLKQHVETLEEYNELSVNGKKAYFNGKVKRANTMHMYIDTSQDTIRFTILLSIVNVIIMELIYHNDDQILDGIDEVDNKDEEDHHMNINGVDL